MVRRQWEDLNPATPLSGARMTGVEDDIEVAMSVPDMALAARLQAPGSAARAAVEAIAGSRAEGDVYVEDYFAPNRVEGVTDDWAAFEAARQTGRRVRHRGGWLHISKSPGWGDMAWFKGAGVDKTNIKLFDSAPADTDMWATPATGAVQGYFADFTLHGNAARQGGVLVAAGGSRSGGVALRYVRHFYVDRVKVVSPVQHGFDVTRGALDYPYAGDGFMANLRSSDVYFDQCQASDFGDDGFTTHSSDHVHFSRCISYNPRRRENCNGFEIDGDSRDITLTNNRTFGCYAGIEVKGHGSESAAQNIIINGHHDTGSVRSYNFRHIGYHSGADPVSQSARNIVATNLVSIHPNNDAGFQDDATPRSLAISAYRGVSITGFTSVGRGGHTAGHIAVSVQFRASDINLSGFNITGWLGAELDLAITTADRVNVTNLTIYNSANSGIYTGSTVTAVNMSGVIATGTGTGTGCDLYNASGVKFSGSVTGYAQNMRADLTNYSSVDLFLRKIRDVPAGITRLIDLDPAYDYYGSTGTMGAMTDGPGLGGANIIRHSGVAGDVYEQTAIRNTTGATIQGKAWRIAYTNKTNGPWNRESINDLVPIAGILPNGGLPPGGAAVGSVWLVRSA